MFGPIAGSAPARRGGKKCTGADAELREQAPELVFDHVGQRADDQQRGRRVGAAAGRFGTSAARQASSPCVKVVSMPLPE